jgi:hypothetical protein
MNHEANDPGHSVAERTVLPAARAALQWLQRIDPSASRRIKGLRLVAAYGIAAALGATLDIARGMPDGPALSSLAGGFALWASVSESRSARVESSRDLALLCAAAAFGAASFVVLAPLLQHFGRAGPELTLVSGAFLVGFLRCFGITGAGLGSQIYIGQLLAYGARLSFPDFPTIAVAGLIAAAASIAPRLISAHAEHPPPVPTLLSQPPGALRPEFVMGLQAATAALVIVALNAALGLTESAWAITASTYVVANSAAATADRVRRRLTGTAIGVPLGLACLPLAVAAPLVVWPLAAVAMVIYAIALPERYDVACAALAFALIATLAASGEHSIVLLASRAWETLLGGALGLVAATFLLPLGAPRKI